MSTPQRVACDVASTFIQAEGDTRERDSGGLATLWQGGHTREYNGAPPFLVPKPGTDPRFQRRGGLLRRAGGAVRLRPIQRAGGGCCPPSADSTSGVGWGAVRLRPILRAGVACVSA